MADISLKPTTDGCAYIIIDIQERLAGAMEQDAMREAARKAAIFARGCGLLHIPVIETRQYPEGLGDTVSSVKAALPANSFSVDKTAFSAYREPLFVETLWEMPSVKTVFISGMESHICVLQTVVDLLSAGYCVHILEDAVISRTEANRLSGLHFMQAAHAVISNVESALFQLIGTSKHPEFKEISALIR